MREMLNPTSAIMGRGLGSSDCIDYRRPFQRRYKRRLCRSCFTGSSGRRSIAFVEEGDTIAIDIPNRSIELKVSEEELAKRKEGWTPKEPDIKTGYLARYAKLVSSANKGAILE